MRSDRASVLMRISVWFIGWITVCVCASALTAETKTWHVGPGGNDQNDGGAEKPFKTIQQGLDKAGTGDRVYVRAGMYRERVAFKKSGAPGQSVVLEGEAGAEVDGSTPWTPQWEKAADLGPDIWRAKIDFKPATLTADGKYLVALLEEKGGVNALAKGVRNEEGKTKADQLDSDFSGLKGGWVYIQKRGEILLRLYGGKDPTAMPVTAAPMEPVILFKDVDHCIAKGLILKNAHYGAYFTNTAGSVLDHCTVTACDHGAWLDKDARACKVNYCEITLNPVFDPQSPKSEFVWIAFKDFGYSDRRGVELRNSGAGHEVAYNFIHDHHDGIETKSDDPNPEFNRDADIHHNLIGEVLDDPLEPNSDEVNNRWHHNRSLKGGIGMRIKFPHKGPLYIYRNMLNGKFWCYKKSECETYVYHNTVLADYALRITDAELPHFYFMNNIFLCRGQYLFAVTPEKKRIVPKMPKEQFDYNLYSGDSEKLTAKSGFEVHGVYVDKVENSGVDLKTYQLTANSLAIDSGVDLSSHFAKPLPDCPAGYFKGKAPDLGAFEFGLDETKQNCGVDPKLTGASAKR